MKSLLFTIILISSNNIFAKDNHNDSFNLLQKIIFNKIEIKEKVKTKKIVDINVAVVDAGLVYNENSSLFRAVQNQDKYSGPSVDYSHGSHVHGIVYLLSENTNIRHYNFFKSGIGSQQIADLVDSIKGAINDKSRIINLSLGGATPDFDEYSVLKDGQKSGIVFVSAAGNDGDNLTDKHYFPSSYSKKGLLKNLISVANFVSKDKINPSSNHSGEVFIGAIGTEMPSYCISNMEVPCYLSGTSQATPVISSAISLLLERFPYMTIDQIKYVLSVNSIKTKESMKHTKVGFFSYSSFIDWLNKDYKVADIFPNRKDLQEKFNANPNIINTKNI